MKLVRSVTGAAVTAAMLATSVAPAMAQSYPESGYRDRGHSDHNRHRRHHRNNDRVSAGEVIGGLAILGIIAAIASSGSKSRKGRINSERAATDACATAVEQRSGRDARVSDIDDVRRTSQGWLVRGTIETQNGDARDDRDRYDTQRFTCQIRYDSVERVDFDSDTAYRSY